MNNAQQQENLTSVTDCETHGWNFERGDTCPVCDGMKLERERIITLLEGECFCDSVNPYQEKFCDACQYVALIKGENK